MRKISLPLIGLLVLLTALTAFGIYWFSRGPALPPSTDAYSVLVPDMVMGRDDAPVTIIEHSSLACPHCASFHRQTLPRIKETYIDTGLVRLVYRDYPLGGLAMAAAMLARCVDEGRFFGLIEVLFRQQETWTQGPDPKAELQDIARMSGLSSDDFDACLDDKDLFQALRGGAEAAERNFAVNSTPTFVVNGEIVEGALPFEDFQEVIERALGKAP